jgi:DNA-binding transcriptional MerR regulator
MVSDGKIRPYYRSAEDTLEDVGITQRQLSYWRKQRLFDPELGPTTRFFTEGDTKRLRFLKRLIDDLGLPTATVKRLVESSEERWQGLALRNYFAFIDVENVRLTRPSDAMNQLVADAVVNADAKRIDGWFRALALQIFEEMAGTSRAPAVYEARMKELLDRLARVDLMARVHADPAEGVWFSPARESDPSLSTGDAERLIAERNSLMKPMERALLRDPPF